MNKQYQKKKDKKEYKTYQKVYRSTEKFKKYMSDYRKSTKQQNSRLKFRYGIIVDDYNKLLKKQSGVCAICGKTNRDRKLFVDHNHNTGEIRGLLCHNCNCGLGLLGENIDFLKKAFEYLNYGGQSLPGHIGNEKDIPTDQAD